MTDYSLMSSADLTNWRDEGIVFDINNQTWGLNAWAQQVIDGPGGYYMRVRARAARTSGTLMSRASGTTLTSLNPTRAQVLPGCECAGR